MLEIIGAYKIISNDGMQELAEWANGVSIVLGVWNSEERVGP